MFISGQAINSGNTINPHSSSMANWRRVRTHSKEQPRNKQQNYLGWSSIAGAEGSDVSKDVLRSKKRSILMTGDYSFYYSFPDTGNMHDWQVFNTDLNKTREKDSGQG